MTDDDPLEGLRTWTHVIYGLHAASVVIGITSAAFIATAFVFGLPSIVAVILNYAKRAEARGTFLESHFRWQIRTFWFGLLWVTLCVLFTVVTLGIGLLIVWLPLGIVTIWFIYRVIRGWMRLAERQPMYR